MAPVCALIAAVHAPVLAESTNAVGATEEFVVRHWTAEQGLPQNAVKALAQTRDGYLWVGTLNGLARFDGVRFKVFNHNNTPEMTHDSIDALAEDNRDGALWIGTGRGLLRYYDHHFERFGLERGITGTVGVLEAARDGGVWFSLEPGQVGLARDGQVSKWDFGPEPLKQLAQLSEEGSWELLALGEYGLPYRLELKSKSFTALDTPRPGSLYRSLYRDADGSLWLTMDDGLWRRNGTTWTRVAVAEGAGKLLWAYGTHDGQLWVGQLDSHGVGLQRLVDGHLKPLVLPEFLSDINVTRLAEDHEGNIWAGSTTGLFRLEPKRIKVYSRHNGLRNDDIQAVAAGHDGRVWLGTGEGVSAIQNGEVRNLLPPAGEDGWDRVNTFLADKQDRLWMGTRAGGSLSCFRDGKWSYFEPPPGVTDSAIARTFYEDRTGRMWISTGRGVVCGAGDSCAAYYPSNGLSSQDIRVIYQDRGAGDMWFGTFGGGLDRLHEGKITAFKTDRGEKNNQAWWVHEDVDGVFWVATEDGLNRFVPPGVRDPAQQPEGRARLSSARRVAKESGAGALRTDRAKDQSRFFTFTTDHGLPDNVINNIQEDDFGYLWLSGLKGIYRISRQQLNEVAAGKRAEVECEVFGEADGMLNSECNGGDNQPAGCKDEKGRIWFPTAQGVVCIDPSQIRASDTPPLLVIEQVKANDEVIYGDEVDGGKLIGLNGLTKLNGQSVNYRLKAGYGRVLEIRYTANSLTAPERARFKYRLDGHDKDWRNAGDRRVAFYTDLRPGDYRFELKACNQQGVWTQSPATFAFSLAPFFWQTWPFYVLIVSVIFSLAAAAHAYRIRLQHRVLKLEEQRALAGERTRIARDLHDDLGASLTGIALQLEAAQKKGGAEGEHLASLAGEARAVAHDLRELAWTTNPRCDNAVSLVAFVSEVTERFCKSAGLGCRLELPETDGASAVPARVRHELLMVLKESLANIGKHAAARNIAVSLAMSNGDVRLEIRDDGKGFDTTLAAAGSGLRNLRERVQQAGGSFAVESRPGVGTTFVAKLPLEKNLNH